MGIFGSKNNSQNVNNVETLKNEIKNLQQVIQKQNVLLDLYKCKTFAHNCIKKEGTHLTLDSKVYDTIIKSKKEQEYEYLVFSGGGLKGISFCGAVNKLEEYGIIRDENNNQLLLKGFAGTSAGSIFAALLSIGYTGKEIEEFMRNLDFDKLFDDKLGYIRDTINFFDDWGFCPGDYVIKILGDYIKKKTGNADYTIEDLYKDKGIKLVIVVTNMNEQKTIYLNPQHGENKYRKIPIRIAVRMSMSIPFLFEPYKYENDYFVDGGVLDNYALHVFDGEYPGDLKAKFNLCDPNPKVLGLDILTNDQTLDYNLIKRQNIPSLIDYSVSYINIFLTENERRMMTPSFWYRTAIIVTPAYPLTKTSINEDEKNELIKIGETTVENFLNNNNILSE